MWMLLRFADFQCIFMTADDFNSRMMFMLLFNIYFPLVVDGGRLPSLSTIKGKNVYFIIGLGKICVSCQLFTILRLRFLFNLVVD